MVRASFLTAAFVLCALFAQSGLGAEGVPTEMDPATAARAVKLAEKLRCLVCHEMAQQIRVLFAAGKTDDEILAYMVQRYGDFVLYQPPLKATTILLWAGPALLVIGGGAVLVWNLRRRRVSETELSDDERERARRLLAGDYQEGNK